MSSQATMRFTFMNLDRVMKEEKPPAVIITPRRPLMDFFIDTAMTDEIKESQAMGVIDGVTTNPSLAAKTGRHHQRDSSRVRIRLPLTSTNSP